MKDCRDKVAVVTGAASGIGRGMSEAFVAAGMKVVLSDIEERALDETTRALRADGADVHAVVTDVSRADQVDDLAERTLSHYGAVHVLCNNAGIGVIAGDMPGRVSWESPLEDWHWIVGVNLMGVVHGIRSFLPIMIEQDTEAHIVNTASLAGLIPSGTLYGTTKFAVLGLSENLYLELQRSRRKPKVSVLCPGLVDTHIMSSHRNRPPQFGASSSPASAASNPALEWFAEQLKKGLSPRTVGEQVLAAIREERFYILTHPEHNPMIEQRMQNILSGAHPTAPPPPPGLIEMLQRSASSPR